MGEDRIVSKIFKDKGMAHPSYWDIGAFHPYKLSNTYFFYNQGCHGLLLEPNSSNNQLFNEYRPKDILLNFGLGPEASLVTYFSFNVATLNTFSAEDAEKTIGEGYSLRDKTEISIITPQQCSNSYFSNQYPDFLSLDTEGHELNILKSFGEHLFKIKVVCAETISFSNTGQGQKNTELIDFMLKNGYMVFADTYINTIFVLEKFWRHHDSQIL